MVCATIAEPAPNHPSTMASPCAAASITPGDAMQTISYMEVKRFFKTTLFLRQLCSINTLTKISCIDSHFHQAIQIVRYRGKMVRMTTGSQLGSQYSFLRQIFFTLIQNCQEFGLRGQETKRCLAKISFMNPHLSSTCGIPFTR